MGFTSNPGLHILTGISILTDTAHTSFSMSIIMSLSWHCIIASVHGSNVTTSFIMWSLDMGSATMWMCGVSLFFTTFNSLAMAVIQ